VRYLTNEVGAARRRDARLLIAVLVAVLAMTGLLGAFAENKHRQATGAELAMRLGGFAARPADTPIEQTPSPPRTVKEGKQSSKAPSEGSP
jgi:hypothetical protein